MLANSWKSRSFRAEQLLKRGMALLLGGKVQALSALDVLHNNELLNQRLNMMVISMLMLMMMPMLLAAAVAPGA